MHLYVHARWYRHYSSFCDGLGLAPPKAANSRPLSPNIYPPKCALTKAILLHSGHINPPKRTKCFSLGLSRVAMKPRCLLTHLHTPLLKHHSPPKYPALRSLRSRRALLHTSRPLAAVRPFLLSDPGEGECALHYSLFLGRGV